MSKFRQIWSHCPSTNELHGLKHRYKGEFYFPKISQTLTMYGFFHLGNVIFLFAEFSYKPKIVRIFTNFIELVSFLTINDDGAKTRWDNFNFRDIWLIIHYEFRH